MKLFLESETKAIVVRGVNKHFLKARDFKEFVVSLPWIKFLLGFFPWGKNALATKEVLSDLSFTVKRGSIHGLFGVNGAGKSTLLACLSGVLVPDYGDILVFGKSTIDEPDSADGIISRSGHETLYENFTAMEHLEFVARLYGMELSSARRVSANLLSILGMNESDANKLSSRLSTGMKKKVAIVRALLPVLGKREEDGRAPVILLDEPSANLDPKAKQAFFELLSDLRSAIPNLTIVIATNDMIEIAFCEDHTAIVNGSARHDEELAEEMRCAIAALNRANASICKLIDEKPADREEVRPILDCSIELAARSTAISAIWWRSLRDVRTTWGLTLVVISSLVLTNVVAMFAATGGTNSQSSLRGYVNMILGIYVMVMIRESNRSPERERDYYHMFSTLICAPISRFTHLWASISASMAIFSVITLIVALMILPMVYSAEFAAEAFRCSEQMSSGDILGLALLAMLCPVSFAAIGNCFCLVPFIARNTFFLLSLLPMIVITFSGIYYDPSLKNPVVQWMTSVNPLTYLAHALGEFLHLGTYGPPPAANWLRSHWSFLSSGFSDLIIAAAISVLLLATGGFLMRHGERFLRRLGRMRD